LDLPGAGDEALVGAEHEGFEVGPLGAEGLAAMR
jgi:hypothetical protein